MSQHDGLASRIRARVRDVPDFPQQGVQFKDITPVLADGPLLSDLLRTMHDLAAPSRPDLVVAIESRGFILGAPLALSLGTGFVPIRKPGKLPWQTVRIDYALEYGTDALEAHIDAVDRGQRVLIVDDVLATGGTASATARLIEQLGGTVVGGVFVIELGFLNGRDRLSEFPIDSIVRYD